jgi:hypothetical protein
MLEAQATDLDTVQIWLENAEARVPLWQGAPVQGDYPFAQWQPPEYVRDRYALRTPLELQAGDYALRLAVLRPDGTPTEVSTAAVRSPTLGRRGLSPIPESISQGHSLSLGTIHVHASDRIWEPPPYDHSVGARLGDVVELVGYSLRLPEGQQVAHPGDSLHLTLIWRCLREMETSYTVFTHLLDQTQQVRGQQDNPPVGGHYPTMLWVPNEIVADEYTLAIQLDAPPGTYVVEVGMYDPGTMQRLPVQDPTGATGDRVLLGQLQVTERSTE